MEEEDGLERKNLARIPANYKKLQGVRYEYVCLNVYHQRLSIKTV
jgi:hypothetical protein